MMAGKIKAAQFIVFLAFCTYMSLVPQPGEGLERFSDKLLHCMGYFALMLSLNIAVKPGSKYYQKIVFLLTYSLVIEICQHYVPNRQFSLLDGLANFSGLVLATVLLIVFYRVAPGAKKLIKPT